MKNVEDVEVEINQIEYIGTRIADLFDDKETVKYQRLVLELGEHETFKRLGMVMVFLPPNKRADYLLNNSRGGRSGGVQDNPRRREEGRDNY